MGTKGNDGPVGVPGVEGLPGPKGIEGVAGNKVCWNKIFYSLSRNKNENKVSFNIYRERNVLILTKI